MERVEHTVLENMCMIQDGDMVLVEEKNLEGGEKGIIFPGGHLEEGEGIVDSVVREIREETGYLIEDPVLCGVKNWIEEDGIRYIVFLFKASKYSGELTSSREGRVFWVKASEVLSLPWIWGMDHLMEIFLEGKYSELFLLEKEDWKPHLR